MISDEQGREWLLQKLYDDGWRYCVMNVCGNVYLTNEMPRMQANTNEWNVNTCKKVIGVTNIKNVLPKIKCNECISIAKELGIVNWTEVEIDTPILVSDGGISWKKRYFAKHENGKVFAFRNGTTSWSSQYSPFEWRYAKLAEV